MKVSLGSGPEPQWKFELDLEEAKRLRRLYVPRGMYRLTATAEHHRTYSAPVLAGPKPAKLDIHLVPLPLARGVVVDAEDRPIAAATVSFPDATPCATANEGGAFTCELPEQIPPVLLVSSSGYAPREVSIVRRTREQEDVDLGRIRLDEGWRVTVNVVRPKRTPARVSLLFDTPRNMRSRVTVALDEGEATVRFNAEAGQYFVLVEGDGPLERLAVPLRVKDADVEEEIRVEPFQFIGSVRFGDAPLAEGTVEVGPLDRSWREPLPVKDGVFSATMWQGGQFHGWVHGPELAEGQLFQSPKLGADPSRWDIQIERRMIVGRVLDATTRAPVKILSFEVEAHSGDTESYFPARVQPDGSYRILAHMPGTYTLRVESPQHAPYRAELRVTAEDRTRAHDIELESGVLQPIDVVAPDGAPLGLTMVIERGQDARTNERGHYVLRGSPGENRLLYFVPPLGSFAIARVLMPRTSPEARPLRVVVPQSSGALRVRSVNPAGTPVPARLLIRYNGEFIPSSILGSVVRRSGTDHDGRAVLLRLPAGEYEIWAVHSEEDERQLIASAGTLREPVRVGLSGGEQAVTVVAQP